MRMSELQRKNIIDIENGTLIGKIIDLEINDAGKIVNLIVEKAKNKSFFSSDTSEVEVKFEQIKKLGNDVILVSFS